MPPPGMKRSMGTNGRTTPMTAASRLRQDFLRLKKDPVPYIVAEPLPSNLLEWHYVVTGPEGSPYDGGLYHGKLVFPAEFPFKPPSIYIITPNGRFKTDTRLCLSISDYHPDTWNPAWSVATILTGLLSFMLEKSPTLGSVETTDFDKRQFAVKSHEFNLKNKVYCDLFPDLVIASQSIVEERKERIRARQAKLAGGESISPSRRVNGVKRLNTGDIKGGINNPAFKEDDLLDLDDPLAMQRRQLERNEYEGGGGMGGVYGAVTNMLVIGGFAAFALIVQYVLQSIANTD